MYQTDPAPTTSGNVTITTTTGSTGHGRMGWQCPNCQRCYAPHVDQCTACGNAIAFPYVQPVYPQPQPGVYPWTPFPWTFTVTCDQKPLDVPKLNSKE